jgi:hypothetical protein
MLEALCRARLRGEYGLQKASISLQQIVSHQPLHVFGSPEPVHRIMLLRIMACAVLILQVNPAGDFVYTSTSATPIDDSFKYTATGALASLPICMYLQYCYYCFVHSLLM